VHSRRDKQFRALFRDLPPDVKKQAYAAYRLFARDPRHPGLHFKQLYKTLYSVRIGISYRALGIMQSSDLIIWIWIGSHAEYDKLLKRLIGTL
jgi:hypothetical protein